ncbi:hypothetical protein MITSMUL_04622 [Mitsuokella multacida DSM 20544]|uniref:Uncharacterized protein n=1 Tax=Mitsuokella multacida DSM 20544 TaxID=500635 RepID=C9KND3_9FIRM|nr:hypothetical protein MITSMUL_04622 [Mitsuokella multacida DSM 20544]
MIPFPFHYFHLTFQPAILIVSQDVHLRKTTCLFVKESEHKERL